MNEDYEFDWAEQVDAAAELRTALAYLACYEADVAQYMRDMLVHALRAPGDMFCTGQAAVLNPVIANLRKCPGNMNETFNIVHKLRHKNGFDDDIFAPPVHTLVICSEDGRSMVISTHDKQAQELAASANSYMNVFMQQRRERERRAADIENLQRPIPMVGAARKTFMTEKAKEWSALRAKHVAALHERYRGARVPRDVMQESLREFWAGIDANLDAQEREAKRLKGA